MPRFWKKLTAVTAEQWFPGKHVEGVYIIPEHDVPSRGGGVAFRQPERAMVDTPGGRFALSPGDWVVTDNGERTVAEPAYFAAMYEQAAD